MSWAAMLLFWLLLVGSTDPIELGSGVLAAAVAATGLHLVRSSDRVEFALRPRWLLILLRRLPLHTLADCGVVLGVVWRFATGERVRGSLRRIPFEPGPPNDAYTVGRRALVVAAVSLAPNAVVVRIDGQDLLVHELVPAHSEPTNSEWPL